MTDRGYSPVTENPAPKRASRSVAVLLFALAVSPQLARPALATDFFVSPSGSSGGDGSSSRPWSLAAALAQPSTVRPGDTIWLRGGTYAGTRGSSYSFSSGLNGAPGAPITVRQYSGERATLDGRGAVYGALLVQYSSWTVFRDFEIMDSDLNPAAHPSGLWVRDSNNIKFVNLVIHDMPGQGAGFWLENSNSEIYGCLIYYNGRSRWEHGIYLDNRSGSKQITDSILFNNYGYGIHGYASSSADYENNITLKGNVSFNNGLLAPGQQPQTNILIGVDVDGGAPALYPQVANNFTYSSAQGSDGQDFGYVKGCTNPSVTGNYFVGTTRWASCTTNATITGNTFYGSQVASGGPTPSPATFPNNTFLTSRPTGAKIVIRPNQYEPGRANIIVYNWDLQRTLAIDLSSVVSRGASYQIRNAQNFFASPVLSGVYAGGTVNVPMSNSLATPVAFSPPAPSGPEFNAFIVLTQQGPPPTPTAPPHTATPTPTAPHHTATPTPTAPPHTATPTPTAPNRTVTPTPTAPNRTVTPTPTAPHRTVTPTPTAPHHTATPTPASPTPAPPVTDPQRLAERTVPVAAHVTGSSGVVFVTDLHVENPTTGPVDAQLAFYSSGGGNPVRMPLTMAPGEVRNLPDVLENFGVTNGLGALRLETGATAPGLRMTSRTYDRIGEGTYGQAVTGRPTDASPGSRFVTGLARTDDFRTNLGAVNTNSQYEAFDILLRSGDGSIIGASVNLALAPGEQMQWSLDQVCPACYGKGLTAEFRPVSGLAPLAYAAVVDNLSQDPTYYPAEVPAPLIYLPVVSHVHGAGGTLFSSDVSLANTSDAPQVLSLTFLQSALKSASPRTVTVQLDSYTTRQMDDVLGELFLPTDAYGSLTIQTAGASTILVSERISTPSPTAPGTVGQQVDPVTPADLFSKGSLLGLRQDDAFRSNIGLFNPNSADASATLLLKAEDGTELATATLTLPAGRYVQENLSTLFPSTSFPQGQTLSIALDAANSNIFAFASVIDNVSQDPTFYPGLK